MNVFIFGAAYYAVISLGFLSLIALIGWLWYLVLNKLYMTWKATHQIFEYFVYRKKFKAWLKDNETQRYDTPKAENER